MNFRIFLFLAVFLCFKNVASSQVRVGDFRMAMYKYDDLDAKTLKRFTAKTTKFILPDYYPKSSYEAILKEVWNVTPYEIIYGNDGDNAVIAKDDAVAQFVHLGVSKTMPSGTLSNSSFHVLDFHVVDKVKDKPKEGDLKWMSSKIASIYFTPDIQIRREASAYVKEIKGDLLNFRLGYLKNMLQQVNNAIKNKISFDLYENYTKPELKNLKKKVLYIDRNMIYGYNPWTFTEKQAKEIDELMKDYKFKYQLIEFNDLEKMIFDQDAEDFYYLMYNQINSDKIVTVINGKTGEIIYQDHTTVSFNLKPKDLKKLYEKILK